MELEFSKSNENSNSFLNWRKIEKNEDKKKKTIKTYGKWGKLILAKKEILQYD